MKEIDDKKINDQNAILENELQKERTDWNDKVSTLVNMLKDNKKLSEAQVYQLSYRQQVQERLAFYRILMEKRQESFDKQMVARYREYTIKSELRLGQKERETFVQADCSALKLQVSMIKTQITYFEECVKTLDNFGFAVRNKIEIVSQQLI